MTEIKKTNEQLFLEGDYDTLFTRNEKFLYYMCKKFYSTGIDEDELYSLACLGFAKTLNSYNPTHSKFITYLSTVITNEFLMFLRKAKKYASDISLDEPVHMSNNNDKDPILLNETIGDTFDFEKEFFAHEDYVKVVGLIKTLKWPIKEILEQIMLGRTQDAISIDLNISQSYVSRCYKKGIAAIQKKLAFESDRCKSHKSEPEREKMVIDMKTHKKNTFVVKRSIALIKQQQTVIKDTQESQIPLFKINGTFEILSCALNSTDFFTISTSMVLK